MFLWLEAAWVIESRAELPSEQLLLETNMPQKKHDKNKVTIP